MSWVWLRYFSSSSWCRTRLVTRQCFNCDKERLSLGKDFSVSMLCQGGSAQATGRGHSQDSSPHRPKAHPHHRRAWPACRLRETGWEAATAAGGPAQHCQRMVSNCTSLVTREFYFTLFVIFLLITIIINTIIPIINPFLPQPVSLTRV